MREQARRLRTTASIWARSLRRPSLSRPSFDRGDLKRYGGILAVVAVVLAVVAVGLVGLRVDTTPASFLPSDDPSIQSLDDAARSFGGDPIVVLVQSAQPRELLVGDQVQKLIKVEGQLSKLPNTAAVYGPGTVINQIAGSAQDLLATLSGKRDATRTAAEGQARSQGAPPDAVAGAGRAALAAFDLRYGSLLVKALPAGLPTVRNPAFVNTIVFDKVGAPRPEMRFVVPSQNAVAILIRPRQDLDQSGTEALVDQARATVQGAGLKAQRTTVTGSPAVASELGTTVQSEIPILGGLAVGLIAACYAFVPWTRRKRHRLVPLACTVSATALVLSAFGWLDRPLSLGVVTFLPILIGIGSDFPAYVVRGADRRVVVVTALASAAGFAALAVSPLPFVRDLGLALGAGVLLALTMSIGFARYILDPDQVPARPAAEEVRESPGTASTLPLGQRVGALVAVILVATLGWIALPQLDLQARPDELAAGLPAVEDAQYAEGVLGSSGEVEILLRGNDVLSPEAIAWMRNAEDTTVLRYGSQLHPIVSVPDLFRFLGTSPSPEEIGAALQLVPSYLSGAVVRPDGREAVSSFGIQLQDIKDQKVLLDGLAASLPPPPAGLQVSVAGLPVAAARGYTLVSQDRYLTNLAGIAAAGLVLVIGLRRRSDAARAVLAALLATGWGLALAWLLGVPLSPLTVALGSLTTATACEFTLLLGHDIRRGSFRLRRTVGVAAGAACLGYLALAASGLAVIREFGLLLAASVLLSLLSSYLVVKLLPPSGKVRGDGDTDQTDGEHSERLTEVAT
jgi:hypothetical protein